MNQSDPAEGKKASLLLNLESGCAVFASYERLFQSSAPLYLKFFFLTKVLYREGSPKGPTSYPFYTILDRKENRFEYLEPTWQDKKS